MTLHQRRGRVAPPSPGLLARAGSFAAVVVAGLLSMGASCRPPKPPTPPTPPPPTIEFPELLLRQQDGKLTQAGKPHLMFGAVPCWDPEELDHGGWTGFDSKWVDYTVTKGANAFHLRLGPYVKDTRWTNGLSYESGPYLNDDAAQGFDPRWWDKALGMARYAGQRGATVQVSLIDGWQCRHAITDPLPSPWRREDLLACGNRITDTHKAFVLQTVKTFGCLANVIWEDGNEIGISSEDQGPYRPSWSFGLRDLVRQYEQEVGCGVVHLFGTNSDNEDTEASPLIDYTATHKKERISEPYMGKYRMCNEHNPPSSPEEEQMLYCSARKAGQAWWYWRGAQTRADMEKTLSLFGQGCDGVPTEGCPFNVKPTAMLKCKPFGSHGGYPLYDCTPADARGEPIWPEGSDLRAECEQKSMGGLPTFALDPPLKVHHLAHGGLAFAVEGHGSSLAHCGIPKEPPTWRGCLDTSRQPLVVTVP